MLAELAERDATIQRQSTLIENMGKRLEALESGAEDKATQSTPEGVQTVPAALEALSDVLPPYKSALDAPEAPQPHEIVPPVEVDAAPETPEPAGEQPEAKPSRGRRRRTVT